MALRISRATPDDVPELESLDELVFGDDHYSKLIWRQVLDLAGPLAAIATIPPDLEVVGFAVVAQGWECGTGWLMGLAVIPGLRGLGIGGKLLQHVIRESLRCGVSTIWLTVDPKNPAVRLYERSGFVAEDADPDYYGKGRERLVMRLDAGR